MASGELKCIGSTTYHDYKSYFERDRALARRFQKIEIPEPSQEEAIKILEGLKPHYEKHHGVHYSSGAIRAAVKLSAKHINDRRLPDKAIDVIDEIGAAVKIQPAEKRRKTIGPKDIEKMVAKIAKIPPRSVSTSDKEQLQNLGPRSEARRVRPRRGDRHAGEHDQALALRVGPSRKTDRLFSLCRAHRRRQDRAGQATGPNHGHRVSCAST